ncbi:serine hydrolase [Cyclobacterium qasimii]|uniref:beta-lactamase n=1 Tax=Cyclobacterium qasimii TaxID=1350429 RepID=A0A512C9G4_9BACT|nr:serine hydrolase [Cyclobacterium qasimii]
MLQEYTATLDSTVVLSYIIQDKDGKVLSKLNADKQIPSASIIKIPLLLYLMEKVEQGELALHETYKLKNSDKVGGSGELQFKPDGHLITYELLASEMIRISDNTATNVLIRKVGLRSFQEWLHTNGYKTTQLNRYMMDFDAIAKGQQNYTSSAEMNRLLLSLLNEKSLNKASTLQVIEWLKNCEDNSALPYLLPEVVAIAHKTGTLEYVRGDAGIIFGKRPIVLTVFVAHYSNLENANKIIAEIARLAFLDFDE